MSRLAGLARALLCVAVPGLVPIAPLAAEEEPAPVEAAERDAAIARGLRYLEKETLALPDSRGTPRKPFDVAAAGYVHLLARRVRSPTAADHATFVDRCRKATRAYVADVERRSRDPAELPPRHGLATSEALVQYTWPLAMAAMFHAELHAQGLDAAGAKQVLARIATLLGEAQAENGGWGHGRIAPRGEGARAPGLPPEMLDRMGGYPGTLLASSVLVASSLGTAQRAVGDLEGPDLGRARRYLAKAQLRNGNFPYDPSQRQADHDATGAGRTAGAFFALWALGEPLDDTTLVRAAAYLDDHAGDVAEGHGSAVLTLLYGALAARVRGDRAWQAYRGRFFRRILEARSDDGAFACIAKGDLFGTTNDSRPMGIQLPGFVRTGVDVYVTALHTWILLLDVVPPGTSERQPAKPRARAPVTPR